jgi:lysophospholipase L1-like esterase
MLGAVALYGSISLGYWNALTGMLLVTVAFLFVGTLLEALASSLNFSSSTRMGLRVAVVTTGLLVVGLELFLRYGLRSHETYTERHGQFNYVSPYGESIPTWFLTYPPGSRQYSVRPEFVQSREVNSLGLPEREISAEKSPNEIRIIALGDSFTDGTGAPYESAWPRILERELASAKPGRPITVVNAGIGGSDVCFEYVLLRDRLLALSPDLVIVAVNTTDVDDIVRRGGMERFRADGSTVYARQPPSWEWLFAISFITRHVAQGVFHVDWLLMGKEERQIAEQQAALTILDTLRDFRALSTAKGFDLIIVLHPGHVREIAEKRFSSQFSRVVETLAAEGGFTAIDLLSFYLEQGLMTEAPSDYFWPIDLHHNAAGYEIMGKAIAARLLDLGLVD